MLGAMEYRVPMKHKKFVSNHFVCAACSCVCVLKVVCAQICDFFPQFSSFSPFYPSEFNY